MLNLLNQNKTIVSLLAVSFVLFFLLSYSAGATFDAGDGIRHYLVSRFSWQHHDLLLYSWGKPFFTIVSSPFSQFGLLGMSAFNIMCGIGSAFFAYKIALKLKLNYAILVIPFLLFTPCYFPTLNSGLTEPFFGFILIFSIYLMFAERFFLACVFISFLPFVRTEGNMMLPLFFMILIYRRKFLLVPLLAFGTLVYSIVGYFYFNDFFWVVNQNPYNGDNKAFYGSGELLHFVSNYNFIWGSTLAILFVVGIIALIYKASLIIKNRQIKDGRLPEELILVYGAFAVYFVAHSIMWWKGLANSLGLLRVIAGVAPCSAIICLRGFNLLVVPYIKRNRILEIGLVCALLFAVIRSPFKHDYFPYKLNQEEALVKEAGDWFKESAFTNKKVYYLYPLLAHVLNVDSFDPNKVGELWGLYPTIKEWGIGAIPDSTIVLWDAHFGPNECKIPLDTIMGDENFQLIKTFKPETGFTTLGGYNFEIYAFMKLSKPKKPTPLLEISYDFEENKDLNNVLTICSDKSFSGKKGCLLSPAFEYSATIIKSCFMIPKNTSLVKFDGKILHESNVLGALIVLSVENSEGKNLYWESRPINSVTINDSTKWLSFSSQFVLSQDVLSDKNTMSVYVWNKSKERFFLDDFLLCFWGTE